MKSNDISFLFLDIPQEKENYCMVNQILAINLKQNRLANNMPKYLKQQINFDMFAKTITRSWHNSLNINSNYPFFKEAFIIKTPMKRGRCESTLTPHITSFHSHGGPWTYDSNCQVCGLIKVGLGL
jgi:hypothetical protein